MERRRKKRDKDKIAELEADLEEPELPRVMSYLWRTYHRLRRRAAPGFNGHVPLSWHDIDAFVRQTGVRLSPWEMDLIESIDDAFIEAMTKRPAPVGALEKSASVDDPKAVRSLLGSIGKRRGNK